MAGQGRIAHAWRAARRTAPPGHLDAAGCNVPSDRVLDAVVTHLRLERERGGYRAVPGLGAPRSALAALADAGPADVAFLESGTAAMAALLGGWRLTGRRAGRAPRVGFPRTEYGSTLMLLRRLAARYGWEPAVLPVDGDGRMALEDLEAGLAAGLDLVIVSHIASHRGTVQPAREIGELCRAAGVPYVLDVCQSLGHVDVRGAGATAYVGTSRKWLAGPRGAGFLIVPGLTPAMDAAAPALGGHLWDEAAPEGVAPLPGAARYESAEAAIGARIGLGTAVLEHHALGPAAVYEHLAALGRTARHVLDGAGGWRVAEPLDEPSALVTLRPPPGDTAERAAARAGTASLLVSVVPTARAPLDLREPVLRVSPPPGTPAETLQALARVLVSS
ncbi:ergothioneine biosynthesis PLP-dependent enzyme EgtE [Nonomuraea zeae]|uniref:Ergothioneine biosynthesis PLP-dependent enzyme EgtE n=1 Tax=Nonomuraea zeae TaxID=1642303 RepID=A0A5S4GBZ3_9ACTN|nr:ergothioneine biosynthesis PLP-dependent enzyme EgtE [Nonomuraea zeae]